MAVLATSKYEEDLIKRTVDYMPCICLYFSGPENFYQAPNADPLY